MKGREQKGTDAPVYLSPEQVADRWGLSRQFVYHCKDLQKYKRKFGNRVRYSLDDLKAFEQARIENRPGAAYTGDLLMRRGDNWDQERAERNKVIFLIKDKVE